LDMDYKKIDYRDYLPNSFYNARQSKEEAIR